MAIGYKKLRTEDVRNDRYAASHGQYADSSGGHAMLKTYSGSCHCGAVRYEADIDLSNGTSKCNCTFCLKARLWGAIVIPEMFRLLSGDDQLSDYYKPGGAVHHVFCRHCGVRSFERGHLDELGGDYVTINVACLDIEPAELASSPLIHMDGRNNKWFSPPAEIRHL
jgi:hypothetical protein